MSPPRRGGFITSQMHLYERQTKFEDLPACADLLREDFSADKGLVFSELIDLWRDLLQTRCANSGVVIDRDRPAPGIVGFGFSLCVTDDFVREARNGNTPYLAHKIISQWKRGERSWLTLPEIRTANRSEGVNKLILHTVMGVPGMNEHELAAVRDKMLDSLFANHRGCNAKYFMKEVHGIDDRGRHMSFGFHLVNDYGSISDGQSREPYLMGISREEALDPQREGMYIRGLFRYTPPICKFTPGDQELLQLAIAGLSESDIAATLGISKDSVKSRWDSVYAHVPVHLEKELYPDQEGKLKSRALLNWLRERPEEWHPKLYFAGLAVSGA